VKAETLLAVSFVCAGATVRYIKQRSPDMVTLVSTQPEDDDSRAREDRAVLEGDLDCCLALDHFDFAMVVQRREGLLVMEPVPV
jgi:phosphosulfolactate phosphohydrolase-like enzyme